MIVTDILKYSNKVQVAKNFGKRADCFHSGKSHISLNFWKHSSIFWKFHLQITQRHLILSHTVSGSFCQTNMCKIELWTSHLQEPQAPSWVNLPSDDFLPQFRSYMLTCKKPCKKHVSYWTRPSLKTSVYILH